ncbi:MAG: hypothetical protein HQL47_03210, partial [Gammaproteobacteria bacterium]|nr:hypothetical protein [Gammaproteobacteria bacterium]
RRKDKADNQFLEKENSSNGRELNTRKCRSSSSLKSNASYGIDVDEASQLGYSKEHDSDLSDLPAPAYKKSRNQVHTEHRPATYIEEETIEEFYATALSEVECDKRKLGLWSKCFAECDGDENKAKARYINNRVKDFKEAFLKQSKNAEGVDVDNQQNIAHVENNDAVIVETKKNISEEVKVAGDFSRLDAELDGLSVAEQIDHVRNILIDTLMSSNVSVTKVKEWVYAARLFRGLLKKKQLTTRHENSKRSMLERERDVMKRRIDEFLASDSMPEDAKSIYLGLKRKLDNVNELIATDALAPLSINEREQLRNRVKFLENELLRIERDEKRYGVSNSLADKFRNEIMSIKLRLGH